MEVREIGSVTWMELAFDLSIILVSATAARFSMPSLFVLAAMIMMMRLELHLRSGKRIFVRDMAMPLVAGLANIRRDVLLELSTGRRAERINQAIYLLRYWERERMAFQD